MRIPPAARPDLKWSFSPAKLYGWLAGLGITAFGGLMCSVPIGTFFGVPAAAFGLFLCLTFLVAMSATAVHDLISLPLLVAGLALLVVGRWLAPVDQIIESFRVGRDLINDPGPGGALGIPLMLVGTVLVATVAPWVRSPLGLSYWRSLLGIVLVVTGSTLLLVGAVLTHVSAPLAAQPRWIWVAVPLVFALGIGLRMRWKGLEWGFVSLATGATLPLIWYLLD